MSKGEGSPRKGDEVRLQRVRLALDRLSGDQTSTRIVLTDSHGSSARPPRFGQPPCIWMSRETVDAGEDALDGELAHEYAHVLDPRAGRDWFAGFSGMGVLGFAGFAAQLYEMGAMPHNSLGNLVANLAVWAAGTATVGAGLGWFARISHRSEFWADRTAAALLGSPGPVIVMLYRVQSHHVLRPRRERLVSLLTHPHPSRRIRALEEAAAASL